MCSVDSIVEGYTPAQLQAAFSCAVSDCGGFDNTEVVVRRYCDHLMTMITSNLRIS